MFSIFRQHSSKGPNELHDVLDRSFQDLADSLIQHMTYEEIRVCMDRPHKDLSLARP